MYFWLLIYFVKGTKVDRFVSETYSIQDCFKYSASETSRTSASSGDSVIPVYNGFTFQSNNFSMEWEYKTSNQGTGVGIAPVSNTTPYHHITVGTSGALRLYIGKETSGEQSYDVLTRAFNTWIKVKITYINGEIKCYINDTLKQTVTANYLQNETRIFSWYEWVTNVNYSFKNLKIKAL